IPAMIVAAITEAFYVRSVLAYAVGGALAGAACYLGLIPFDPETMRFDGIVRRHLEIMTGAGILAGLVYWMIAGRNAGAWRAAPADASGAVQLAPAVAVIFPAFQGRSRALVARMRIGKPVLGAAPQTPHTARFTSPPTSPRRVASA